MKNVSWILASTLLAAFALQACGKNDTEVGSLAKASDGASCDTEGTESPADDGCNTCTCTSGAWACTEMACNSACEPGEQRPAGDGCNTCSCEADGASWSCTEMGCPETCTPGEVRPDADGCNTCACSEDGKGWACTLRLCEPTTCTPGESRSADDGCNTCSCSADGSSWECTVMACACEPGETRRAPDLCNVCSCGTDGYSWSCTERACSGLPERCGGTFGDTCTDDEYCAWLVDGAQCGATGTPGTCWPRPTSCEDVGEPVCGCDGRTTYGNRCEASAAGTGVLTEGVCTLP